MSNLVLTDCRLPGAILPSLEVHDGHHQQHHSRSLISPQTAAGAGVQIPAPSPNNRGLPGDAISHSAFGSIKLMRFANHADRQGTEGSLEAVLGEIQNPPCQIKSLIAEIRGAYLAAGGGGDGKAAIRELKSKLPAATFSATGGRRTVESANGLIVLDLDELKERLQFLRREFEHDQHVVAVFVSPSGDGLKVVFRVPSSGGNQIEMRRQHRRSFKAVEAYVHRKFGVQADPAASDLLRLG